MYKREEDYVCMCINTPYNDYLVGAMVTHQVGLVVRAAVLHLLSETPISSPLLSSPIYNIISPFRYLPYFQFL